jgi:hypothetical protein
MDLVDLLNRGAETVASLDDATCLQKAAEQFLGAYATFNPCGVVAASAIAERVLGAAMMLNPEVGVGGQGRTVIFDVNVASGTQLARAARRLRDLGNSDQLVGIALYALVDWRIGTAFGELTEIVVAHQFTRNAESDSWQCGDRSNRGLEPALR